MATKTVNRTARISVNPIFKTHEVAFLEDGVVLDKKGNLSLQEAKAAEERWVKRGQ